MFEPTKVKAVNFSSGGLFSSSSQIVRYTLDLGGVQTRYHEDRAAAEQDAESVNAQAQAEGFTSAQAWWDYHHAPIDEITAEAVS